MKMMQQLGCAELKIADSASSSSSSFIIWKCNINFSRVWRMANTSIISPSLDSHKKLSFSPRLCRLCSRTLRTANISKKKKKKIQFIFCLGVCETCQSVYSFQTSAYLYRSVTCREFSQPRPFIILIYIYKFIILDSSSRVVFFFLFGFLRSQTLKIMEWIQHVEE